MLVDGVVRNLQKRRYCLMCSPWGKHNTRQLHLPTTLCSGVKKCPRCQAKKSVDDFYRRRNNNEPSSYCKKCTNDEVTERMTRFKQQCVNYKGGKCKYCGYQRYLGGLEFHHLEPEHKDFNISNAKLTTFNERVKIELDKCRLLCSICHREEHARLAGVFLLPPLSQINFTNAGEAQLDEQALAKRKVGEFKSPLLYQI